MFCPMNTFFALRSFHGVSDGAVDGAERPLHPGAAVHRDGRVDALPPGGQTVPHSDVSPEEPHGYEQYNHKSA